MSALKIWIISGWVHLAVGFAIGWIVFKRPQWATDLINKAIEKIRFW